jgi:hypothetical protein
VEAVSVTVHLNAVMIGGACCVPLGAVLAWAGLAGGWGHEWGAWLARAGTATAVGGVVAALIGVGMAVR